jgi:2-oxoglutarate ferredoxin oxidoreductase subunit delta
MPQKGRVDVDDRYCKGCELCVNACPQDVLALSAGRMNARGYHPAELVAAGCTGCGVCAIVCPEAAIKVYREVAQSRAVVSG